MIPEGKSGQKVPVLDFSVLERQENKEHLLTLLKTLTEAQTEEDMDLPEDPILKLVKVSKMGLDQLRLEKSGITSRSDLSARSVHSRPSVKDPERELRKLKREVQHKKRALENYEFFFKQPEVAETVNSALGKLSTLKCAFCHKFFVSQHFLDQHMVRRHPEQAGSGAEQAKKDGIQEAKSILHRKKHLDSLNNAFLQQYETLQRTVLTVSAQKGQIQSVLETQDPATVEGAARLREALGLQEELNRLLEQQQKILNDQATQIREMQNLQEQLAGRPSASSSQVSRTESAQTSFFDRQSLGEAGFSLDFIRMDSMRSPRVEELSIKPPLDQLRHAPDLIEEEKSGKGIRRKEGEKHEIADPESVEMTLLEEKQGKISSRSADNRVFRLPPRGKNRSFDRKPQALYSGDLSVLRKKTDFLSKKNPEFVVFPERYGLELCSLYAHTSEEVLLAKNKVSQEISGLSKTTYIRKSNGSDYFRAHQEIENRLFALERVRTAAELGTLLEEKKPESDTNLSAEKALEQNGEIGMQFHEGPLVSAQVLSYKSLGGNLISPRLGHPRESLMTLDYETSLSFSIRWGDEEEESGEWKGIGPDEARRLGFFFQ